MRGQTLPPPVLDLSFRRETLRGLGAKDGAPLHRKPKLSVQFSRGVALLFLAGGGLEGAFPCDLSFQVAMCRAGETSRLPIQLRTMRSGRSLLTGVGSKVTSRRRSGRSSNPLGAHVSSSTSVPTRDSSRCWPRGESDVAGSSPFEPLPRLCDGVHGCARQRMAQPGARARGSCDRPRRHGSVPRARADVPTSASLNDGAGPRSRRRHHQRAYHEAGRHLVLSCLST